MTPKTNDQDTFFGDLHLPDEPPNLRTLAAGFSEPIEAVIGRLVQLRESFISAGKLTSVVQQL